MIYNHMNWEKHPKYKTRKEAEEATADIALMNHNGNEIGLGGCLICGDNWLWKTHFSIPYAERRGAFPTCEECFRNKSIVLINEAIDALGRIWSRQSMNKVPSDVRAMKKKAAELKTTDGK